MSSSETPADCISFGGKGKFLDRPPCLKLKHFLAAGDSLYDVAYYYCYDCKRIWCHNDIAYVKNEKYWEASSLEYFQNVEHWSGWITAPPSPPQGSFDQGIEGFERWLATIDEALDFTRPI